MWTRTRRQLMAGAARCGLAALIVAGAGAAASAQSAEKLAPLADGFPNKQIVLLVIDEPGSTDSVYANQIAEQASKISPQRVIVEHRVDFTNFGTWEGIAWLKDQGALASDGYIAYVLTQPDAVIDMVAIDIEEMTGVTFDDFNPIIATEQVPFMLIQRADAPWGDTLEEFVAHAKANPGTVRHITGGPGGGQDAAMRVWLRHLGVTVNDIIGGNPTERALAVASGEGDITVSPVDVLTPHFDANRVEVLMGSGADAFPAPWDKVPSAGSLGMTDDPFDQTRTIAVSPDVSAEHAAWLFELFSKAGADPDYQARRMQISGLTPIEFNREQSREHAQTGYDKVLPIFKELGIYWGDQK
ncbi:Bug family tripartite tricarboxylate transporter substrate binding protein [Methylobrevis albus]|uniref:Tripartite-type tricarboxylate transporter, receptor component TctC n=1 Tax=Methylobrevis albus TaxID=2793297 RepID=A0A931N052_9HYPH|nr:tripartite tricarboxylate transporter substrate-binding protein [Methylobrevis albus]MBH0238809.1 hypothetical protein [Methylobrevis albus]